MTSGGGRRKPDFACLVEMGSSLSFGIIRALKALQKGEQFVARFVATDLSSHRSGLLENFLFDGKICIQVYLGGFQRFVPEPKRDY